MTKWTPETEEQEQLKPLTREDWENMTIAERVNRAAASGFSGKLGSKNWDDMTPGEKTTIMHPEERPATLEYQVKAHIALEDSDSQVWGILKDLEGSYSWKPGEGQIVGTWSRSPQDNLIHVFLETSIQSLVDKSTLRFAEYAEKRRTEVSTPKTRTRAPRVPKPELETEASEALTKIASLRDLFKH